MPEGQIRARYLIGRLTEKKSRKDEKLGDDLIVFFSRATKARHLINFLVWKFGSFYAAIGITRC
jgi:hypothetical protein